MTIEEEELNRELHELQNRAKRLVLSRYYDSVNLSDLQYSILRQLTNADTINDISTYLWNSGAIETVLNQISHQLAGIRKNAYKEDRQQAKEGGGNGH